MIVNLASSQWIKIDGVILCVQLALHVLKVPIGQLVNVPLQFAGFFANSFQVHATFALLGIESKGVAFERLSLCKR